MKDFLLKANKSILFACTAMYFGTGWSLVLFSFPIAPSLTPDNYYNQFVPQVTRATGFFTYMTILMMICAAIIIIEEWKTRKKWYPIGVLIAVIAATLLTTSFILPYNAKMAAGITDNVELHRILSKWITLNIVRVSLWTVQWLLMLFYFLSYFPKKGKLNTPASN